MKNAHKNKSDSCSVFFKTRSSAAIKWGVFFVLSSLGLLGPIKAAEPLHGPNVNPANLAVLVEWEKFTGRKAGVIGDNFSADRWHVLEMSPKFRAKGKQGAISEQLRRWQSAFDGSGVIECGEGAEPYRGSPKGAMEDYVLELAIPMFPNLLESVDGEVISSFDVPDRWVMGDPLSRHHAEAKKAFQAFATALVECGMSKARLRLGWEFSGRWFPWGLDPEGGDTMGTPYQYKACWKFIYLTMEEVNPDFTWVWCSNVGFDHFDPGTAFPHYPDDDFTDPLDDADKILADFVSVDVYDADGEVYYQHDDIEGDNFELVPGYWNAREEDRKVAFEHFDKKIFEGKGHLAKAGESTTYGLRYFKILADQYELPFLISEWGPWTNYVATRNWKEGDEEPLLLRSVGFGGEDNRWFIDGLFRWSRDNDVGYSILFEFYNGGSGDTVDHTLLPGYWNSPQEGRPPVSLYPEGSPYAEIKDQFHPQAAEAYLLNLQEN